MGVPDRIRVLQALAAAGARFVLIGAQAARVYGSSRESYDIDFAVREIDVDTVLDVLYAAGYRLPASVDPVTGAAAWAADADAARLAVNADRRGALNLYWLDEDGDPVDQMDFVYDNPMPFAHLFQRARVIRQDPEIRCAAVSDLVLMKQRRLASGSGSPADTLDLDFLLSLDGSPEQ